MKNLVGMIILLLVFITSISLFMKPSSQKKEYRGELLDIENGISKIRFYEVEPAFKTQNPNITTLVKAKVIRDDGGFEVEYDKVTYKVNDKSLKGKLGKYVDIRLHLQESKILYVEEVLEKGVLYTFTSNIEADTKYYYRDLNVIDVNIVEVNIPKPPEIVCFVKGEMGTFELSVDPNNPNQFFYRKSPTLYKERGVYMEVTDSRGIKITSVTPTYYSELKDFCKGQGVDWSKSGFISGNINEVLYNIGL